ncbi:hypothetical protein F3Y22_tig00110462pilonHSYRG00339 [Hibiscus syriacus]|uniref:C3H1-type domain-containing protein n=1 Tax=Hibiscus syriacus TaxID=106335 RepID=A0A6A3AK87_HIBSY|nr:hypothetical protein F3Y22_tig00110462pilonHSYRG00339 [Hibiscus syriacus]
MYTSRHVVFDELQFPFAKLHEKVSNEYNTHASSSSLQIVAVVHKFQHVLAEGYDNNSMTNNSPATVSSNYFSSNVAATSNSQNEAQEDVVDSSSATQNDATQDDDAHEETVVPQSVNECTPSEGVNSDMPTNTHHMMTRSKCGVFKPKVRKETVQAEFDALLTNNTWTLVKLPEDRTAVGCYDFKDTYNPIIKFSILNIVLSIAVTRKWCIRHVDVNNAFLNGKLAEDVFMQQSPGFEKYAVDESVLVCKLNKALYGLRQAPRNWHDKLKTSLIRLGFTESKADVSLFVRIDADCRIYILVYVDDIIITGDSSPSIDSIVHALSRDFSLKDLRSLAYFLGIKVKRTEEAMLLSQRKYIIELLEKICLLNATPTVTPMIGASKMTQEVGALLSDAREYRSIVGALLYVCHTRPDIAFSVNKATQFMHAPRELHLAAVKRILKYLASTLNYSLTFSSNDVSQDVVAFTDADWGGSLDDRRSVSGHAVFLGHCLVIWCSKKQKIISRSTMEAEYRIIADAAVEVMWMSSLLCELGVKHRNMPVEWCDNTSTVALSTNPVYHSRSKLVDMDVHFVREKVAANQLQVNYVHASHQVADVNPTESGSSGQLLLDASNFPERPDQPECRYYMNTVTCKYGSDCKYHHPKEMIANSTINGIGPLWLPSRPPSSVFDSSALTYQRMSPTAHLSETPLPSKLTDWTGNTESVSKKHQNTEMKNSDDPAEQAALTHSLQISSKNSQDD